MSNFNLDDEFKKLKRHNLKMALIAALIAVLGAMAIHAIGN
jgi:hypothetical protein